MFLLPHLDRVITVLHPTMMNHRQKLNILFFVICLVWSVIESGRGPGTSNSSCRICKTLSLVACWRSGACYCEPIFIHRHTHKQFVGRMFQKGLINLRNWILFAGGWPPIAWYLEFRMYLCRAWFIGSGFIDDWGIRVIQCTIWYHLVISVPKPLLGVQALAWVLTLMMLTISILLTI